MREFLSEGYVHHYGLQEMSEDGQHFVFVSEKIENAPVGLRSRLTLEITGPGTFRETFELAGAGEDFKPLIETTLHRQ